MKVERKNNLINKGNADAYSQLAGYYTEGRMGMPQNSAGANELYLKAGELGCNHAYHNLGNAYYYGRDVAVDMKKAKHYFELGAMNGSVNARHNIGAVEENTGNLQRAYKHYMIAARSGYDTSLAGVEKGYVKGIVSKDEYANVLRSYHKQQESMKSDMRDKWGKK